MFKSLACLDIIDSENSCRSSSEMLHGMCLLSQADRGDDSTKSWPTQNMFFVCVRFHRFNAEESLCWTDLKRCCHLNEPILVSRCCTWCGLEMAEVWISSWRSWGIGVCLSADASQCDWSADHPDSDDKQPEYKWFFGCSMVRKQHHVVFLWVQLGQLKRSSMINSYLAHELGRTIDDSHVAPGSSPLAPAPGAWHRGDFCSHVSPRKEKYNYITWDYL